MPLLSCGNWGGNGLHLRGNVEGFVRAASEQKWLEMHGGTHWAIFYTDYANALQRRFFDYFLKGEPNGWDRQPHVLLNVRHPGEKFVPRHGARVADRAHAMDQAVPAGGRQDAVDRSRRSGDATVAFEALGDGVMFWTAPFRKDTEITGPLAAKLFVSSSTSDADLFLVVRVFDPDGKEVTFQGALDPHTPVAQGWLRASHRKLDPKLHACRIGPTTPTTSSSRSRPASRSSSTSRSGRPASWCRKGYRLALHGARQGLRMGRPGRDPLQHEEPDARLRPVRA